MRASKKELSTVMDTKQIVMKEVVWGEMHVEHDVFMEKFDVTPLLKGLPNDRCQCPHWGIVLKGQIRIINDGKEEIAKAGDAYYMPPGHTVMIEAGTELWEFSPNDKLQKTMTTTMQNLKAMSQKK